MNATMAFSLLFFILMTSIEMKAQSEQYEHAIVFCIPINREARISMNGSEYREVTFTKEQVKGPADVTACMEEVQNLIAQGWEVKDVDHSIGTSHTSHYFTFHLQRVLK